MTSKACLIPGNLAIWFQTQLSILNTERECIFAQSFPAYKWYRGHGRIGTANLLQFGQGKRLLYLFFGQLHGVYSVGRTLGDFVERAFPHYQKPCTQIVTCPSGQKPKQIARFSQKRVFKSLTTNGNEWNALGGEFVIGYCLRLDAL